MISEKRIFALASRTYKMVEGRITFSKLGLFLFARIIENEVLSDAKKAHLKELSEHLESLQNRYSQAIPEKRKMK